MNKIIFPLKAGMKGSQVGDLQDALQLLLDKTIILSNDEAARSDLSAALQQERTEKTYGRVTSKLVSVFQEERWPEVSGEVDEATAKELDRLLDELTDTDEEHSEYVVNGTVRFIDGLPTAGIKVSAFDRDLRSEQLLGETTSDHEGRYKIKYNHDQFRRAEKRSSDLVVRAFDQRGNILATSDTVFNAQSEQEINLFVIKQEDGYLSEYEQLFEDLKPVIEDLTPADLTEEDIDFLSGETGQDRKHIDYLRAAYRLTSQTDLPPEAFYGFFREDLPTDLPSLVANSSETLHRVLNVALRDNIIPATLEDKIDEILRCLLTLKVDQPVFLVKPEVLYGCLNDFSHLTPEQADFVNARLSEHLRHEILNALGPISEAMNRVVKGAAARLDYQQLGDADLSAVIRDSILAEAKKDRRLAEETAELEVRLAGRALAKVVDLLNLDVPLQDNPLFKAEIHRAKTVEYARLAGLDDLASRTLLAKNLLLDEADENTLSELVKEGILSDQQKLDFQLTLELGKLTDDNLVFISILKDGELKSVANFIGWDKVDWQQLISDEGLPLPPGETAETYAENVLLNIEKTYPAQVLLNRLASPKQPAQLNALDSLTELFYHNDRLVDGESPISLDWRGVSVHRRKTLQQSLQDLTALANTYRHLELTDLINDKTLELGQKKNAITTRLQLLNTFYQNNQELDLRLVNFFDPDGGNLDWTNISLSDRPLVRKQLMAYQRVLNLAGDTADRQMLLNKGFDSALAITAQTEADFMKNSGLPLGKTRLIYADAQERTLSVVHHFGTIRDVVRGQFRDIAVANLDPKLINDLREIDGFDDLFGSQDYCDCEECRSILSPAAYFVDLMYFIEHYVSKPIFIDDNKTDHPLYLKNRRSDLWTLQLTCENTNTDIPYLTIVNEVLENYLKQILGANDIYNALSSADISFNLPFNLPLEEARLYLNHFSLTLADIYRTLKQPETKIWRARLNLSPEEFEVITTHKPAEVMSRFGNPASLEDFPVNDYKDEKAGLDRRGFIKFAGISRQQLSELLELRFNDDLANIKVTKLADPDELQNFHEVLKNLTGDRMDFIHRFIRLWRKMPWDIPDLDLVLTALKEAKLIGSNLDTVLRDADPVLFLGQLVDLQEKLKLSVEELCSLVGQLPVSRDFPKPPTRQAEQQLYERLFDLNKLFGEKDPKTHELNTSTTFHHYSFNTVNPQDKDIDPKTPLLLSGLGVSETELLMLFGLLKDEILFDASGNTKLDRQRISLFYRHARMAKALKLSIQDFIEALRLNFGTAELFVTKLAQIRQLQKFREWLKASSVTISEMRFILRGEESSTMKYKIGLEAIEELVKDIQKQKNLFFGKDLLAEIEKVSKKDSEKILGEMEKNKLINISAEGYSINPAKYLLTQQFIGIFAAVDFSADVAKETEIREKLNEFHPFVASFTVKINVKKELYHQLVKGISVDLGSNDFIKAIYSTFDEDVKPKKPKNLDILLEFSRAFERILSLVDNLKFESKTVKFITENQNSLGIADLKSLTLDDLKFLTFYRKLITLREDVEPLAQKILKNYSNNTFSDVADLADLLQQDKSLIESLNRSLTLPAVPIEALEYIWECLNLCQTLGVNGYSLQKLADDADYNKMVAVRDVVLGAFTSKYDVEQIRREMLEPYQDKINVIKRDALCDYIIAREKALKFKDLSDIYAFFLLDVEMSRCFRTSRVVCATSSLQLYVHRILTNLEQSVSDKLVVLNEVKDLELFKLEWGWRKNYRVWEANRKVFLYTENYLDPSLLDNKTPIYKGLGDELLQEKITKEAAEAAYMKYVSQFAELTRLKIVGSYYHSDTCTYYFFGRTQQDPPQYYYRKWIAEKEWAPWEKIELVIKAPYVSAIIHLGRLYLFWVETNVMEITKIEKGDSKPQPYEVKVDLAYSYLNENGKWIVPQNIEWLCPSQQEIPSADNRVDDKDDLLEMELSKTYRKVYPKIVGDTIVLRYTMGVHIWDRILDLFNNRLYGVTDTTEKSILKYDLITVRLVHLQDTAQLCLDYFIPDNQCAFDYWLEVTDPDYSARVFITAPFPCEFDSQPKFCRNYIMHLVHDSFPDFILTYNDQQYLIKQEGWAKKYFAELEAGSPVGFGSWSIGSKVVNFLRRLVRLSTSLANDLGQTLFSEGLEPFLSLKTQKLVEKSIGIEFTDPIQLNPPYNNPNHIDFEGAYGIYYQELFFHIPFLIANHLNANQKFKEATWWYERIFDPTASESPEDKKPTDRNWRYIEFRDLTIQKMKDILTDQAAIEQYKKNSFNPHAIARLRLNAYQKAIVMKYIDNLLDWGDYLFTQDTRESINEATMLYILAADILGKRPVKLGKCETAKAEDLSMRGLAGKLKKVLNS